jgi:hypothetical protein
MTTSSGATVGPQRVFVLTLEGDDDIHGLRAVLKQLLRRHGMRCLSITAASTRA